MSNIQVFNYEGNKITFDFGNGVMVNATEMAKSFGKQAYDWLKTQSTKEFLEALSVTKKIGTEDLVQVKQGGTHQGTWFHEDVALEFARWLSPMFAIWCNDRIKELLTGGHTIKELYDIIKQQQAQIKQLDRRVKLLTSPRAKKERKRRLEVENADNWIESGRIAAIASENGGWIPFHKIMDAYVQFCKDEHVKRIGKNLLGEKLQRKFEHKKRRDTTWYAVFVVKE